MVIEHLNMSLKKRASLIDVRHLNMSLKKRASLIEVSHKDVSLFNVSCTSFEKTSDSEIMLNSKHTLVLRARRWFSFTKARQELRDPLFWHDVLVETVLCMFSMCSVIWVGVTCDPSDYKPNVLHFGIYAGFFIFVLIEGWGPLGGASVNPARTWACFICGRFTPLRALVYTIVEITGGAAGSMIAYSLIPEMHRDQIQSLVPGSGVTALMGMGIEGILTFNLIFVGLVACDPKLKPNNVIGGLVTGFAIGTGVMVAGTLTGGYQNPVLPFGYAMISGNFTDHWLYWVGPYLGSTIASFFFIALEQLRTHYGPQN